MADDASQPVQHGSFHLWPPRTRKNSPYWTARGRAAGKRFEFSTRAIDLADARNAVENFLGRLTQEEKAVREVDPTFLCADGLPRWGYRLWDGARARAGASGVPFTMTKEDVLAIIRRANGRCEVSGIPFSHSKGAGLSRRRPFAPSLDRIVPAHGYIKDNCRLVCFAANVAMSDWGLCTFLEIAHGAIAQNAGRGAGNSL